MPRSGGGGCWRYSLSEDIGEGYALLRVAVPLPGIIN